MHSDLDPLKQKLNTDIINFFTLLFQYKKSSKDLNYICQGYINLSEFFQIQFNDHQNLLSNMLKIDKNTNGVTFSTTHDLFKKHFYEFYSRDINKLALYFGKSFELIKFLDLVTTDDIENLREAVNDSDDTLMTTKATLDLVILKTFLVATRDEITKCKQESSQDLVMQKLLNCFESAVRDDQSKNIFECFESCNPLLSSIEQVHNSLTQRGIMKGKQIVDIMKHASFKFLDSQTNKEIIRLNYHYDVTLNFNELIDLRDLARLVDYSNTIKGQTDSTKSTSVIHSFISFVDTIENIIKHLTQFKMTGYLFIETSLELNKIFTCKDCNFDELVAYKTKIGEFLVKWECQLNNLYKEYIELTYFKYDQVWSIEKYLQNRTTGANNAYHLLKYIGIQPESFPNDISIDTEDDPANRLRNIGKLLYSKTHSGIITNKYEYQGNNRVFVVKTSEEGVMRAVLSCFKLVGVSARANRLFSCTEKTTWMELKAFAYRCFYSNTFHLLIRSELLTVSIQDKFIELLLQLINLSNDHRFQVGIITTSGEEHQPLINVLRTFELYQPIYDHQMLNKPDLKKETETLLGQNCFLITSDMAGLGKSTYIRNRIDEAGKQHIKFPISGYIDLEILVDRLHTYVNQSTTSKIAIHIDIGIVFDINKLHEFLYCILLFRSFCHGLLAVSLPVEVPIYIELDSSPQMANLYEGLTILHFLQKINVPHIDWVQMNMKCLPGIQLVAHYLRAIQDKSISQKEIKEETFAELDRDTCSKLLLEQFDLKNNEKQISWTSIKILITIYYYLFSGFCNCAFFSSNRPYAAELRMDILQYLIKSSKQFTSYSVESVRKKQRSLGDSNINLDETIIRWDKLQPFTVIFTEWNDPLFVYKNTTVVPRSLINAKVEPVQANIFYRILFYSSVKREQQQREQAQFPDHNQLKHTDFFIRLAALSKKYYGQPICNSCFKQYENTDQSCINCEEKGQLLRPKTTRELDIIEFQMDIARRLEKEYVWTADNYTKALLIYLRIQCRLPVILIGETGNISYLFVNLPVHNFEKFLFYIIGCGKTALIQCLCEKILDDELVVFHMHAGITDENIDQQMQKFVMKANESSIKEGKKRFWVFFDEFNTTLCIGLLKEILCERTLHGRELPDNMRFLAACNPQRWKKNSGSFQDDIGIKKDSYDFQRSNSHLGEDSLIYHVLPIPESMLEYVWDYGFLDGETETSYIQAVLNSCEQLSGTIVLYNSTVKLVAASQQFFRKNEDTSSISLRDVARFCQFYNWFLRNRTEPQDGRISNYNKLNEARLLALLLTYYLRLSGSDLRKSYLNHIKPILEDGTKNDTDISNFLTDLLRKEQEGLIKQIELPLGTAKNRALLDNIFVLYVCTLNRIPVILCGKPGTSKTLAANILLNNLKGKRSNKSFFEKLPELIPVSYQGSKNCTSESVLKVFERADKYLNARENSDILPVIVFDEIGLAELSPHNPLKVLHSKLETDTCKYGFIGISNWHLDAAKTNRTLYLACPDPNRDELILTATTISSSLLPNQTKDNQIKDYVQNLANAYFDLQEHLKTNPQYNNYFGLRDFYSLIKGVVNGLINFSNKQNHNRIIKTQLAINFDGVLDGSDYLWKRFCHHTQYDGSFDLENPPTFIEMIAQSFTDRKGRYLMLIGDNETLNDYAERYIKKKQPNTRTLIGSSLPYDSIPGASYSEQYNQRVLLDVIFSAESNVTLIMRRMDHIYANLYDLFNQNFHKSEQRKFCRIAFDNINYQRVPIHEDFFCIILVERKDLLEKDPPFLNRFEKHVFGTDSLIHSCYTIIASNLLQWINNLAMCSSNKAFPQRKNLFVDYNPDNIRILVMDAFDSLNIPEDYNDNQRDTVIEFCKKQLIRTSSFDLLLLLSYQMKKNDKFKTLIDQCYEIRNKLSFSNLIDQTLKEPTISNHVIYTYTQIYDKIEYLNENNLVVEIKIAAFKTEFELKTKIKEYYQSKTHRLLLIRVDYHHEHKHLLFLKHLIQNVNVELKDFDVWLVLHLQRNLMNDKQDDVLFNGWISLMIDNLNQKELMQIDVLTNPSYPNLLSHANFSLSRTMFNELVNQSFVRIRYTVKSKNKEQLINQRRDSILELFTFELIKTVDLNYSYSESKDWRQDLLNNPTIVGSCRSIDSALQMTILLFYCDYFLAFLVEAEKSSLFDSCRFLNSKKGKTYEHLKCIWFDCLRSVNQSIPKTITIIDTVEIPLIFDLRLPCGRLEQQILRHIYETTKNETENLRVNLAMERLRNTIKDQMKYFLLEQDESIKLLNLSEVGFAIIGEDKWNFEEQFCILNNNETKPFKNSTNLYVLIQLQHQFYQVPPQESFDKDRIYRCDYDPLIEISLMNLIELLISPSTIENADSIVQLLNTYGFIAQSILYLNNYEINNLEKLRSFESLLRCVMELLPNDKALVAFKDSCHKPYDKTIFDGTFSTCNDINKFMRILTKRINKNRGDQHEINSFTNCRPLLKLEVEFLKNWLIDHGDEYCTVLDYIYKSNRNFWHYSAKIFKYIDKKFDLMSIVRTSFDEISSIEELKELDKYLSQSNNETRKVQRIMINRINNYLLNDVFNESEENINERNRSTLEEYLTKYFYFFQTNINAYLFESEFQTVVLIAWLKTYLQIYAFLLYEDLHSTIMDNIDKFLAQTESPFCSTLKIFIMKNLCQNYRVNLDELYENFVNRTCLWIRRMFSHHQYQQQRRFNQSIILPTPLYQTKEENMKINNILENNAQTHEWRSLINDCSTNQQLTYCFIMSFVHQYGKIQKKDTSNMAFKTIVDLLETGLFQCFGQIENTFLCLLYNNFPRDKSYFQLNEEMGPNELHRRLLALNITALFLSYKADKKFTFVNSILFNEHGEMPQNYEDHLQSIYLPGLIFDDRNNTNEENRTSRLGYHSMKSSQMSNIHEKPDHLELSISYRFIHMIIHAILLVLHELELLENYRVNYDYCRDHFERDYELICQLSDDPDQCYIWLYKLINHLVNVDFQQDNSQGYDKNVIEFEKYVENQVIIPHIGSIDNEIREYKLAYNKYVKGGNTDLTLYELIDELVNDENTYPLLSFFNTTKNHIINPVDSFQIKLQTLPGADKKYPMTMFFFKQSDDYENIRYLYPIITFVEYLRQKFNYRITRKDAERKTIEEVLSKDSDKTSSKLYENFIEAWYQLKLKEVYVNSQPIKFEHKYSLKEFSQRTEIAKLFINSPKDSNSCLLIGCIKTISDLQNKIVQHFNNIIDSNSTDKRLQSQNVPLQSLQPKHLLFLDKDMISTKLMDDASVVNHEYGMSKEIIYDFEEIEFMIREKVSCLPLIDTGRINMFNYQFELSEENASLINDIRRISEQKALPEKKRDELQKSIDSTQNGDILHCIGLLDQIFTYLRHCERQSVENLTIKTFIEQHIGSKTAFNDELFQDSQFLNTQLTYVVDLYQLFEEIGFDKILRNHIEKDLRGPLLISIDDETCLIDQFIQMTSGNIKIAAGLKTLDCWINMLKRLLLRVSMNTNLKFDVPLQNFACRSDFWTVDVTKNDIQSFKITDDIQLRHALIILKCLEQRKSNPQGKKPSCSTNQRLNTGNSVEPKQTWFPTSNTSQRKVIDPNPTIKKKTRV
ncbi:unnamed protein product [Adineta ricciae]|uniref:Uncharacterized protein n=1 Tax=Adineta ricciae TaxID=249248 RepID=A0A815UHA5_ADIRI|nr:unnamed protein product [Adineta ricciae]